MDDGEKLDTALGHDISMATDSVGDLERFLTKNKKQRLPRGCAPKAGLYGRDESKQEEQMNEATDLTEEAAARAYARAWNRLECAELAQMLASDAKYTSFWVFADLDGSQAIAHYLTGKMRSVAAADQRVYAELATTTKGFGPAGKPCVALAQANKNIVSVIVTFKVEAGMIKQIDLSDPEFFAAIRSGEYPA